MKQTLEEAVNEIGGVHPDWDKITCFRIGFEILDRNCHSKEINNDETVQNQ